MTALELTRELIRFDTINPPGAEAGCARHLAALLERAGFSVGFHDLADGRPNLVARIGGTGGRSPLCFTGHLDVVPLGAAAWSHPPFAAELDGNRLYGRGSSDMKSGVAAFIEAAVRLAPRLGGTPGLVLVLTAGEETGCEGARALAARPSALGRAGAIVVAEPTGNAPCVGHKGALWLRARTTGVTAHGSMPERGVNAIYKAARAVTRLETFSFEVAPHPVLGRPTLNVGTLHGGLNVNSVPDAAEIGVDIRTIPEVKHAPLLTAIQDCLGTEVEIRTVSGSEAVWSDPAAPWMQEVFEIAERVAGIPRAVRAAPYFTDASALTPAMGDPPTVILGPGETGLAHQTDEYCLVERIEQAVEMYTELARRWCGV